MGDRHIETSQGSWGVGQSSNTGPLQGDVYDLHSHSDREPTNHRFIRWQWQVPHMLLKCNLQLKCMPTTITICHQDQAKRLASASPLGSRIIPQIKGFFEHVGISFCICGHSAGEKPKRIATQHWQGSWHPIHSGEYSRIKAQIPPCREDTMSTPGVYSMPECWNQNSASATEIRMIFPPSLVRVRFRFIITQYIYLPKTCFLLHIITLTSNGLPQLINRPSLTPFSSNVY